MTQPGTQPANPPASAATGLEPPRVLAVGLSCLDHLWRVERFPPQGSRTPAQAYASQGGGPAATAAVTVARLGGRAALWAVHGDDAAGRAARAELESYGVDCAGVRALPDATSFVSAVLVAPGGERYIFPFYSPDQGDDPSAWDFSGLEGVGCLLIDARHPRLAEAAAREARRRGVPVVGDFSNIRHWPLAALSDYLLVSEECAAEVLGEEVPAVMEAVSAGGAALERLRQRPGQLVGVTLGERGFIYDDGKGARHVPALRVEAVDTTGAGDVFHGAYAYGVAAGWNAARCASFSSVVAGLKCRSLGGRAGIPSLGEALAALDMVGLDAVRASPGEPVGVGPEQRLEEDEEVRRVDALEAREP